MNAWSSLPGGRATREFFSASQAMTLVYAGATGFSFLVGIVLARLLGVAGYGTYALAMTSATLAGLVTEFGLPMLAMREAGKARASGDWAPLRGLMDWAERVILILSALVAATFVTWWLAHGRAGDGAWPRAMLWGVALIPTVALGKLRGQVLLAFDHVYASQIPGMILRPALFVAGCLLWWCVAGRLGAPGAMAVQAISTLAATVCVAWMFRRAMPRAFYQARREMAVHQWVTTCLPMGLSEGLRMLQGQLALLAIGWLAGAAPAGLYRVADAVTQVAALAMSVVGTACTAMFARLHSEGDRAGLERVALLAGWAMVGGVLALGLPVVLAGHWLFALVFGKDFSLAMPLFVILWSGMLVTASCGLALSIAAMTGHHLLSTQAFVLIVVVNAGLGLALIPAHGAVGGAMATAISSATGSAWCTARLRARAGINASVFNSASFAMLAKAVAWR